MRNSVLSAFGVAATAGAVTLGMTMGPATADAAPGSHTHRTVTIEVLSGGKIITSGTARLSASGPVFDEQFAITGGTGTYQNASGQVRVLQETMEQAKVTFKIQP